ncbi:hypothetical protein EUGRSUZ_A00297 [Eucalyptus grandis]|uniref:Uncharacterized protein n=2 Tax=Eucalyptus grandis TaxID=71139 RepID=A0ACC3LZ03_EUCGR|nr:hypothetical protein EUGRSUZ_A00297 [Eucalyptus grandis]
MDPPQKLQWLYYQNSCPDAEKYVRDQVEFYWKQDRTLALKLIRLLYSDCFITLSLLGLPMEMIDKVKEVLEQHFPGDFSCTDIINLAAKDAVVLVGGTSYPIPTGRRDGNSSSAKSVDLFFRPYLEMGQIAIPWKAVPGYFKSKGLNVLFLTTLRGCSFIPDRLYDFNKTGEPDPSMDPTFLSQLREQCPPNSTNLAYLNPDLGSSYSFGNSFYSRVRHHQAVLGINQQIASNFDSSLIAWEYDVRFGDFQKMFGMSTIRMGNIKLLPEDQG